MKRRAVEQHLRANGGTRRRHGGRHDIWVNPANGRTAGVPRHRTVKRPMVRAICRQLNIPLPDGF